MAEPNAQGGGTNPSELEFVESEYPVFKDIDPANATQEQVEQLVKAGQKLFGISKHFSTKVKTMVEKPKEEKPAPTPTPTATPGAADEELRADVAELKVEKEKRLFQQTHSLTLEETDHVFGFAKGMGLKPADALNHPFIKSGLESMRQQNRVNSATPGPSGRAPVVEGKTFSEMSTDEKRKNFGKVVRSVQGR